jgi:hypothetical protein
MWPRYPTFCFIHTHHTWRRDSVVLVCCCTGTHTWWADGYAGRRYTSGCLSLPFPTDPIWPDSCVLILLPPQTPYENYLVIICVHGGYFSYCCKFSKVRHTPSFRFLLLFQYFHPLRPCAKTDWTHIPLTSCLSAVSFPIVISPYTFHSPLRFISFILSFIPHSNFRPILT